MREKPHHITFVKIISFHYLNSVSFHALEKNKLMYSHFAGYPCEKCKRQFYHRMEAYKTSDPRIHFLNRYSGLPATEGMNPPFTFYSICHCLCSFPDIVRLCLFDPGNYVPYVI